MTEDVIMRCLLLTLERVEDGRDVSGPGRSLAACLERRGWAIETLRMPASGVSGPDPEPLGPRLDRTRPDVVIVQGLGPMARDALARARGVGAATALMVGEVIEDDPVALAAADVVIVPSRFAADYYRDAFAVECVVLPDLIDPGSVVTERRDPTYLTFVDPSVENGVHVFARIADELGRRRRDIPILVVEGRGTEATVAACGLDLREHGNVHFMAPTKDPRRYWSRARICLMPSLCWRGRGMEAVEAMSNGIPAIASDRGALPETLGSRGIVLALPDRITPATRWLPTVEEVIPWVEAVIRLWDDHALYDHLRQSMLAEACRWDSDSLGMRYETLMRQLATHRSPIRVSTSRQDRRFSTSSGSAARSGRARSLVLVPHLNGIEWECEVGLASLEREGVRVVRRRGSSQIDLARSEMVSEALHDGFKSILFIDADLGFDPADALRLLARPEPVVSGVYAKKARREMASQFAPGIGTVRFGSRARGPYPLRYAATGFLRIHAVVLRRMIEVLELPLCNARWGRGFWPFFLPMVVPDEDGGHHYLGEDWAFSHRLGLIGAIPLADTSIRLWHYGPYAYGWEDAGQEVKRYENYSYHISDSLSPHTGNPSA